MRGESFKHYIIRKAIAKILSDRKRRVKEFTKIGTNYEKVDLLDVDNMIAYQVEHQLTRSKLMRTLNSLSGLRDVFFIDVLEVPDDMFEMEVYLKEKVV